MNLEEYERLVMEATWEDERSRYLNLNSNFKIGLGIEHKEFCDAMIGSGIWKYQAYAPEYNPQDSYLRWHEGVLELRVWRDLCQWHMEKIPRAEEKLRTLVQTNGSDDATSKAKPREERLRIMKDTVLFLTDFAKRRNIAIDIPDIYYNHPNGSFPVWWYPDETPRIPIYI